MNEYVTPPHPDDQLPKPLRVATRLFSAWWTLIGLGVVVTGYIGAVFIPLGGRYLWQTQILDLPQSRLLRWLPFHLLLMLFVSVLVWTAIRRVPWRVRSLGVFVFVIGFSVFMVGQSTAWRFQTRGLLAVQPAGEDTTTLQTRYLDPARRVLFVQIGTNPPQQVPLDGLPRWHDAGPDRLSLALHPHPGLRSQLNYRAQVHAVAYIADGTLVPGAGVDDLGTTTHSRVPQPTPAAERDRPLNDIPPAALVALRFTANSADGPAGETTVWLPFDLAAGQHAMPRQAYDIAGLGTVRLTFTLANHDLGFAVAAEPDPAAPAVTLRIVDTDPVTRQIIPAITRSLADSQKMHYRPAAPQPTLREAVLTPGPWAGDTSPRWVTVRSTTARPLVLTGGAIALAGLLLALVLHLLPGRPDTDDTG